MKKLDTGLCLHFFKAHDVPNKKEVATVCVQLAEAAKFPTDYSDVYSHLFDSPNYDIIFVTNSETFVAEDVVGFAVFCIMDILKYKVLYGNGIILHPVVQRQKLPYLICSELISMYMPDFITAKTHNPRAFRSMATLAGTNDVVYPNLDFRWRPIPQDILHMIANHPFLKQCDEHLVFRNAYPDEKLQQETTSSEVKNLFADLGENDAQAIVIRFVR